MPTTVVNIRLAKEYDVYIGRAGHGKSGYFGNPYHLLPGQPRGSTLDKFRQYFYDRIATDSEFATKVLALKDHTLGCFCKPYACHGDIIAEWLDNQ